MSDHDWDRAMADLSASAALQRRISQIWATLSRHLMDVGVEPLRDTARGWNETQDSYGPFGYNHPRWHSAAEGRGVCSVRFCPERIAHTTDWLNDFDLEEYLVAIEVQLDYDIAHYEMEADDAAEWFVKFILARAPGSWRLMTNVQKAWRKRG
jgi:hypothetical protein